MRDRGCAVRTVAVGRPSVHSRRVCPNSLCAALSTGPAAIVTSTSATLTGYVSRLGPNTTYHFDYGPTSTYGSSTPDASFTAASATTVAVPLSGLTSGVTYHYRIVASSASQTVDGLDRTFTAVDPNAVEVSEVRLTGPPGSSHDAYVDLYNATGASIDLTGWQLRELPAAAGAAPIALALPPGTVLPAAGHFLLASSDYSLAAVSAPDEDVGLPANSGGLAGVAVVAPDGTVTDAVGYAGASGYDAGTGLTKPAYPSGSTSETAFVRRFANGAPVDTNDNAADFEFVAPDAGANHYGDNAVLGAPAPLNLSGPRQVNGVAQSYLLDPSASEHSEPNVEYDPPASGEPSAGNPGTLIVRRAITNVSTDQAITALEIRLTGLSTSGTADDATFGDLSDPAAVAILSVQSTPNASVTDSHGNQLSVIGTTLTSPGAGLNSTLSVPLPLETGSSTVHGLAPGQAIAVAMGFSVLQAGQFAFAYNAEDDLQTYAAVAPSGSASGPPSPAPTITSPDSVASASGTIPTASNAVAPPLPVAAITRSAAVQEQLTPARVNAKAERRPRRHAEPRHAAATKRRKRKAAKHPKTRRRGASQRRHVRPAARR